MASSLHGLQGQLLGNIPQPTMPFALDVFATSEIAASSPITSIEDSSLTATSVATPLVTSHRVFKSISGHRCVFNDEMTSLPNQD
jgi:hypothetical protein